MACGVNILCCGVWTNTEEGNILVMKVLLLIMVEVIWWIGPGTTCPVMFRSLGACPGQMYTCCTSGVALALQVPRNHGKGTLPVGIITVSSRFSQFALTQSLKHVA